MLLARPGTRDRRALVAGIHTSEVAARKDVDSRNKGGRDEENAPNPLFHLKITATLTWGRFAFAAPRVSIAAMEIGP
jgi:hypothetical protein